MTKAGDAPTGRITLKIATFNINNVNKRLPNLLAWLKRSKPDVVCLQELKCAPSSFPEKDLLQAGYSAIWESERSWNGVAILVRGARPIATARRLAGDLSDHQSRYIEAAVDGIVIGCIYAPNGNPQPGPKFDYKLSWLSRLARYAATLQRRNYPAILAGDYNIAPTDLDIYSTKSWSHDALIQREPRKVFEALIAKGWTDGLRDVYGHERVYTFWTYWRNRFERDHGVRLDHLLISKDLAPRLVEAGVDADIRGIENASDHAPAWIKLR